MLWEGLGVGGVVHQEGSSPSSHALSPLVRSSVSPVPKGTPWHWPCCVQSADHCQGPPAQKLGRYDPTGPHSVSRAGPRVQKVPNPHPE